VKRTIGNLWLFDYVAAAIAPSAAAAANAVGAELSCTPSCAML
jgi:hypothetical protein